ncbi:4-hydroxyphenylacetate catabolism regulatory protein HpaA [Pseudonocardia ailaonensis]|uniref:4-hydroxyphenylacetate catabolism regulatory protein HpaA n=1 Tax=Pseudonocardia ailaonensis TaxID=367279 RepID=A0ABN2N0G9_9PSEU
MASGGRSSVPLLGYDRAAGPAVTVQHGEGLAGRPFSGAHAHDFLMLSYVVAGSMRRRVDGREWALGEGDVFVLPPGAVVGAADEGEYAADTWIVFFPADAVDPAAAASLVSWQGHPLLAPFGGDGGEARRLHVPADDRPAWLALLTELADELRIRRDGYADAARALLTLLLVRVARLGIDGREQVDPLVSQVFAVIEERFAEDLSLRDVAAAVGLTAGHLTTVVRRSTGRTVQQWITERRMREARRLLAETSLTVAEVAGKVGYRDPGYFQRRFRAAHGTSPGAWR